MLHWTVIFFAKGIIELKSKGVYKAALIKKRHYWPKGVPDDLIDINFEYKKVGDVGMIEARTEENKYFEIFCMKDRDYVTKIMASWVTLDELEGENKIRYFIDSSVTKEMKQFK